MADNDTAEEKAARAVHEAYNGKGTWSAATAEERSKARHAVRLVQNALGAAPAAKGAAATRPVVGSAKKYW